MTLGHNFRVNGLLFCNFYHMSLIFFIYNTCEAITATFGFLTCASLCIILKKNKVTIKKCERKIEGIHPAEF